MKLTSEAIACIAKHGTCSPHWKPYVGISLAQECERLRTALEQCNEYRDDPHKIIGIVDAALAGGNV